MSVIETAKAWLFKIAIQKGIGKALQVGIGALAIWLGGHAVDLQKYGITVNVDTTAALAGVVGGLEVLRNWLKVKKGWTWL